MHVLQLGPYPPPEGGINRNILAIREELRKAGHRCSIIATSKSSSVTPEADVYHPRTPLELLRLLTKLDYDILHLHIGGDITARVMTLVFICSLFRRGKNILSFHSGGYPSTEEGKRAKRSSIRGSIFRRFSRVIAVNSLIANVFESYGVQKKAVSVILPYVHRLPDPNYSVPETLKRFAAKHSPFILTVGLLEAEYDLSLQIDALEHILEKFPDAGLMIVGSGSLSEELANAIAAKPYANKILLAGDVEHAAALHLIRDADVLLRTTLFDGDAISVREALFLGTPVVATDNGMRPVGIYLINVGDKEDLVGKVSDALSKPRKKDENIQPDTSNIDDVLKLYQTL